MVRELIAHQADKEHCSLMALYCSWFSSALKRETTTFEPNAAVRV